MKNVFSKTNILHDAKQINGEDPVFDEQAHHCVTKPPHRELVNDEQINDNGGQSVLYKKVRPIICAYYIFLTVNGFQFVSRIMVKFLVLLRQTV